MGTEQGEVYGSLESNVKALANLQGQFKEGGQRAVFEALKAQGEPAAPHAREMCGPMRCTCLACPPNGPFSSLVVQALSRILKCRFTMRACLTHAIR